eukprot:scaffold425_cov373-Pinguiococcus_pyrenoidosus.AAC.15
MLKPQIHDRLVPAVRSASNSRAPRRRYSFVWVESRLAKPVLQAGRLTRSRRRLRPRQHATRYNG